MSKRQVIVLWIIALVLTVTVFIARSGDNNGFSSATDRERGQTLLDKFPASEVAELAISNGDDSVRLKKNEGKWIVTDRDNYPANTSQINELIRSIAEVEVNQGIEADAKYAPRFGMDPEAADAADRGTNVTLANDAGTDLAKLTFGKNLESASNPMSPFGGGSTGRFVRNLSDNSGVYVVSELFPTLEADASSWLDDTFLRVEKIQSVSVSEPGKTDTIAWKLTRKDENANFELDGAKEDETPNTTVTSPLKNLFSYARFDDVVPAEKAAESWKKEEKQQAVIETFEGFVYTINFAPEIIEGDEAAGTYLMTVEVNADIPTERKKEEGETEEDAKAKQDAFDERKKTLSEKLATEQSFSDRTYEVSKFTVDALLKDRAGLLQSATPAPQAGQPGMPGMMPPGLPGQQPRRPVQAVTPPIAIPPAPTNDQE